MLMCHQSALRLASGGCFRALPLTQLSWPSIGIRERIKPRPESHDGSHVYCPTSCMIDVLACFRVSTHFRELQ